MNLSTLPSFKHDEYVRDWLSSARPLSSTLEEKRTRGETRNEHEKQPRSHSYVTRQVHVQSDSPFRPPYKQHRKRKRSGGTAVLSHRYFLRANKGLSGETRDDGLIGTRAKRVTKKQDIDSQPALLVPDSVDQAITGNNCEYPDRVAHEGPGVTDGGGQIDSGSKLNSRRDAQEDQKRHDYHNSDTFDHQITHDPSLKYARRPRHKTREDRYEYKGHEGVKKDHKITGSNKRYARRKSGAVLNEEFQAPNVDSERLTLKQVSGPGFLSKGKSSGPVPRRGIPDLTFSEMSFLNKRRELDNARYRGYTDHERPKKTARGSAQDISEFFAQPACPTPQETSSQVDIHRRPRRTNVSENMISPLRPNRGRGVSDTSRNCHKLDARPNFDKRSVSSARTWHPDPSISHLQHFRRPRECLEPGSFPGQATSYVSWSPSIEDQRAAPQDEEFSEVEGQTPATRLRKPQHQACTVHPRSSVSNINEDSRRYKPSGRLPLNRAQSAVPLQNRSPKVYYSLDDLKSLAENLRTLDSEDFDSRLGSRSASHLQRPGSRRFVPVLPDYRHAQEVLPVNDQINANEILPDLIPRKPSNTGSDQDYGLAAQPGKVRKTVHENILRPPAGLPPSMNTHSLSHDRPSLWADDSPSPQNPGSEHSGYEVDGHVHYHEPTTRAFEVSELSPMKQHRPEYQLDDLDQDQNRFVAQQCHLAAHGDDLDRFDAELLESTHSHILDLDLDHLDGPRISTRPPAPVQRTL